MTFHFGSFAIGYAAGLGTAAVAPRLRRLGVSLATVAFRVVDGFAVRAARKREDLEDILAEARARARTHRGDDDTAGNPSAGQSS
jgi:hypothetical protein